MQQLWQNRYMIASIAAGKRVGYGGKIIILRDINI